MQVENPLRKWRLSKGFGPERAASDVGVKRQTWWRWETGASNVAIDKLSVVESVTSIPREELRPDLYRSEASQ